MPLHSDDSHDLMLGDAPYPLDKGKPERIGCFQRYQRNIWGVLSAIYIGIGELSARAGAGEGHVCSTSCKLRGCTPTLLLQV